MDTEREMLIPKQPLLQKPDDDLAKIRKRFAELMSSTSPTPELMLAHLLGIVNECQRLRAKELKGAENMERQVAASRAKAEGLSLMASIVYQTVNGFATGAERTKAEEKELAKIDPPETPKKRKKRKNR